MPEPVWKRPAWITAMVGLVSAFLTVPDIVGNYLTKQQDIELAKEKTESVRLGNLESKQDQEFKIVHSTLAQQGSERVFVLRYLASTLDDEAARGWAQAEVTRLDNLAAQQKERNRDQRELEQKEEQLAEQISQGKKINTELEKEIQKLKERLVNKDSEVAELRENAGIGSSIELPNLFYVRVDVRWDSNSAVEELRLEWGDMRASTTCYRGKPTCESVLRGEPPQTISIAPSGVAGTLDVTRLRYRARWSPANPFIYRAESVGYDCTPKEDVDVCTQRQAANNP